MQGTIAQLLSLAAYGNKYLSGLPDDNYYPGNSIFMFCKFVKFIDVQKSGEKWIEQEFADDPQEWFETLKDAGVIQIRVRYISTNDEEISDRMSAAFVGGGGRWLLEAVKPNASDFWEADWVVGDREDPDQKIWHVKYGRILRDSNQPEQPSLPVEEVKKRLKNALIKISEFAHSNDYVYFGECFDRGISALSDSPADIENAYKIFPDNYAAPQYHQLINACQSAWVFGGMGSWNDIVFGDGELQDCYEELSDELFSLVNLALVVASNPFPRPSISSEFTTKEMSKKWWQFWKKG